MSKNRADLKSALRSLDVSKSLRIPPQLGFAPPQTSSVSGPAVAPTSSSLADSLSKLDGVDFDHSSRGTLSNSDGVQIGQPTLDIVHDSIVKEAVPKMDTVKNEQRHIATAPIAKDVTTPAPDKSGGRDTQRTPFTAVPNFLLREEGRFSDPLDFMIYLHLFTYSRGFGRDEASMSQAQLERFTGASKNTVKRSMDRLTKQGLIKCVEEYEHARMSRRFRVNLPSEQGSSNGRRGKAINVFIPDGVQNGEDPKLPGCLSNLDSATVSKAAIYKESIPKEKSKNFLSPPTVSENLALARYFEDLKPARKRERETFALKGLRQDYSESEIGECLGYLLDHGIPGSNQSCHSPLAFLMNAMDQVLLAVSEGKRKNLEKQNAFELRKSLANLNANELSTLDAELDHREKLFIKAFPTPELRREFIHQHATRFPGFDREGPIVRNFAINAWWEALKSAENPTVYTT